MELLEYLGRAFVSGRPDGPPAPFRQVTAADEVNGRREFTGGVFGSQVLLVLKEGDDLVVRHVGPFRAR